MSERRCLWRAPEGQAPQQVVLGARFEMHDSVYTTWFDEDVQTNDQCPECCGRVTTNMRETVCEECGLVLFEEELDRGPEWRAFDVAERRRTGGPVTERQHDRGLATEIGYATDGGRGVAGEKRRRLARLRKRHSRSRFQSKRDRNLAHGLSEVQRIASAIGLAASIGDQACRLFRSAQTADLLPGRSIESMAAAAVYGACRCNGLARTLDEIDQYARGGYSGFVNAYKVLNRELGLPTQPMTPQEYVPRLASNLDVPERVRRRGLALAVRAEKQGVVTGKHPAGFAGACLYVAAEEADWSLAHRAVAEAADACVATVRAHRETVTEIAE